MGGTFTDVALIAGGRLTTAKVPTTTATSRAGSSRGSRSRWPRRASSAGDVARLGHGTTVATNALLERRGARTALVATAGFARPADARPPDAAAPLPARGRAAGAARGRSPRRWTSGAGPDGVLRRLDPESVERAARRLRRAGVEAVAVCLLHSYAHPRHEREVARRLRRALPGRPRRRVGRCRAGVPGVRAGLDRGGRRLPGPGRRPVPEPPGRSAAERGLPEPDVMQSSGGVCALEEAAAHPVRLLLSGPAGGVAAVSALGIREAVSFDMGGTSTDVCLIRDGEAGISSQRVGRRTAGPRAARRHPHRRRGRRLDRLARRGRGVARRAAERGRRSGAGGLRPRRTPADGHRRQRRPRPARPEGADRRRPAPRRPGRAGRRCARSAAPFRSLRAAAEGVIAVANEEMVRAIRVVSVEQGHDPRGLELVAFGGAGPLHACDVADLLGMRRGRRARGRRRALGARHRGGRPAHRRRSRA